MTSRLRRMLLVNVRTSGLLSSGSINEVDPRDGAAITGDNSVGKTTTLELIPLFFGNLPSQISRTGGGKEPMLRFVLPTPQSAIVFEYQRGPSEAHDVRFVVLRRQDGSDAPEYRLFHGPFREDVFITSALDEQDRVFMNDAQSVDAAKLLGVETERKLNPADYRAVILGLKATNQDAVKLRQLSMSYSFATKSLPNLDKLVAAVVKEKVDFREFVNVAVTMVQDTLGGLAVAGAERHKFSLRQSRDQIHRWLINREACETAFKNEHKVTALRSQLSDFSSQESVLREMRADVLALQAARLEEKTRLNGQTEALLSARQQTELDEARQHAQLALSDKAAGEAAATAQAEFNLDLARCQQFQAEEAEAWAPRLDEIDSLRANARQLTQQIELAQGQASSIANGYEQQIAQARQAGGNAVLRLEQAKQTPNQRFTTELTDIGNAEKQAVQTFDHAARQERATLEVQRDALLGDLGQFKALAANPGASPEVSLALEKASAQLEQLRKAIADAKDQAHAQERAGNNAKVQFHQAEARKAAALQAREAAQIRLQQAKLTLAPPSGTLLSALRAAPDTDWKNTLARVMAPELLQRTDLSPRQLAADEASHGLYGWLLDTQALAAPDWVDDDALRQQVSDCAEALTVAEHAVNDASQQLSDASATLAAAEQQKNMAASELAVQSNKLPAAQTAQQLASERLRQQRQSAAEQAQAEVHRVTDALAQQSSSLRALDTRLQTQREALQQRFSADKAAAQVRCAQALAQLELDIAQQNAQTASQISGLQAQRDEHLSSAGVDLKRLKELGQQINTANEQINQRESKKSVVQLWQQWLGAGGHTRHSALAQNVTTTQTALTATQTALCEHSARTSQTQKQHDTQLGNVTKRLQAVESDLEQLATLDDSFGGYQPRHASLIDPQMLVPELRGQINGLRDGLAARRNGIVNLFRQLRDTLTAKESAVKELIEKSLLECQSQSDIQQAQALCTVFNQIWRQIATDVNANVLTVLENIGQFRNRIESFESEVNRFNKKLQAGMDSVSMFERLRDFKIGLITDFETLGFMKKLKALDDVIRFHRAQVGIDPTRELPPESTAAALRDFMSVLGTDGTVEVDMASHITLSGCVTVNGQVKQFKRDSDLDHISSNGLNAIILITLLSGMLNMIRGSDKIYIPWVSDEVGKFDPQNFHTLMQMLKDNHIDVVTASPKLTIPEFRHFARCYRFRDRGSIAIYAVPGRQRVALAASLLAPTEVEA